jgi:hypothetical protein
VGKKFALLILGRNAGIILAVKNETLRVPRRESVKYLLTGGKNEKDTPYFDLSVIANSLMGC